MIARAQEATAPVLRAASAVARWYCVHTKPRSENRALEHLQRQQFECFLPRIQRRVARKSESGVGTLIEPLFPRYLFLRANSATQSLAPIRSTCGVLGLVRFANQPAAVADSIVDRLREDTGADGVIVTRSFTMRAGDAVEVHVGALVGLCGVYDQPCGGNRALVLLKMLGAEQKVVVAVDALQSARAVHVA